MEEPTKYDELLEKGHEYEDLREFDAAIKCFEEASNLDPKKSEAWLALYTIYTMNLEEPERETFYLKKYLELEQNDGMCWNDLGRLMLEIGEQEKALGAYSKAFQYEPSTEVSQKILELKEQGIKPKSPLDIPLVIEQVPLKALKATINLADLKKRLEKQCLDSIDHKQCVKCNKMIPLWWKYCFECGADNPIPAGKVYTNYCIEQMEMEEENVALNYAGGGYSTNQETVGGGLDVYNKNGYDDLLFFFQKEDFLWKYCFNANIEFLKIIPRSNKLLVITRFTKEETLKNPLDRLIKSSRKDFICDFCGNAIPKKSSYWRGHKNLLNDTSNPHMFEMEESKICLNCRELKQTPDFPIAHIFLLNFEGEILMDYPVILDIFGEFAIIGIYKPDFSSRDTFSVIIHRTKYIFDLKTNQLLSTEEIPEDLYLKLQNGQGGL